MDYREVGQGLCVCAMGDGKKDYGLFLGLELVLSGTLDKIVSYLLTKKQIRFDEALRIAQWS